MASQPFDVSLKFDNPALLLDALNEAIAGAEGSTLLVLRELRHEIGKQLGWLLHEPGPYAVVKARLWKGHEDTWVRIGDRWFNDDGNDSPWVELIDPVLVREGLEQ